MSIRTLTLTGLATLTTLAGGLLFTSAPALATELYESDFSFGSGGPGTGSFTSPQGIAVDQSSGAVYVYDAEAGSIYKFDSSGHPAEFSTLHTNVITGVGVGAAGAAADELAVDNSTGPAHGDIYIASNNGSASRLGIYAASGAALGELTEHVTTEHPGAPWGTPCGVAVDPTGHVYVGLFSAHASMYTPTANPVTDANFTSSLQSTSYGLCDLAADGHGNVYVAQYYGEFTSRYTTAQFTGGTADGTEVEHSGNAVAVDPATNDLFVDDGSHVTQFDSAGALVRSFATLGSASFGVAVNGSSSEVYVADSTNHQVDAFKLVTALPPSVNDQPPLASEITRVGASLSGVVNPQGRQTTYAFVYGPTSSYVRSTPTTAAGAGSVDQPVGPVAIEGLRPGATYHYALRASNAAGITIGPDQTFTAAAPALPLLATGASSGVTQNEATLSGTVNAQGLPGTYGFELATTGEYGSRIGLGVLTAESSEVAASFSLGSLEPGTTYRYRITATNTDGTSYGAEQTFTTAVLVSAAVTTPLGLPFLTVPTITFPTDSGTTTTTKSSTNAQKLAKALKACRKKPKAKRAACERQAHKRYTTTKSKQK